MELVTFVNWLNCYFSIDVLERVAVLVIVRHLYQFICYIICCLQVVAVALDLVMEAATEVGR